MSRSAWLGGGVYERLSRRDEDRRHAGRSVSPRGRTGDVARTGSPSSPSGAGRPPPPSRPASGPDWRLPPCRRLTRPDLDPDHAGAERPTRRAGLITMTGAVSFGCSCSTGRRRCATLTVTTSWPLATSLAFPRARPAPINSQPRRDAGASARLLGPLRGTISHGLPRSGNAFFAFPARRDIASDSRTSSTTIGTGNRRPAAARTRIPVDPGPSHEFSGATRIAARHSRPREQKQGSELRCGDDAKAWAASRCRGGVLCGRDQL